MPSRPSRVHQLHASIGRFVLVWAEVELNLDMLVLIARRLSLRSSVVEVLHDLTEKANFIRSEANSNPRLRLYRPIIERAVAQICRLSDTRHNYIHNTALNYTIRRRGLNVTMSGPIRLSTKARRSPAKVINKTADQLEVISGKLFDVVEAMNHMDHFSDFCRIEKMKH
jgi:hypothetical protein